MPFWYIVKFVVLLLSHMCRFQQNETYVDPHVQCPRFVSEINKNLALLDRFS